MSQHPIMNVANVEFERDIAHGDKFAARLAPISTKLGARKLGYNVTAVPPGKRAFPLHHHHANEEMFYILSGEGTLRHGERSLPVKAGDVIACPPGKRELAHQLVNTGTIELRYLAVSTMIDTDIVQYPDSGKVAGYGGRQPGARPADATFWGVFKETPVDYYEGE